MPRHPPHPGDSYTRPVIVKMNTQALATLDRMRGTRPRGAYLRDLLRAEALRQRGET